MKKSDIGHRSARRATDETKTARYLELHAAGMTVRQIADETGNDYQVVYNTLKNKGVEINKVAQGEGPSVTSQIVKLWDEGNPETGEEMTISDIRTYLQENGHPNMKYQQVYNTLKNKGLLTPTKAE